MKTNLKPELRAHILQDLQATGRAGPCNTTAGTGPVHTVYEGAHLLREDTFTRFGRVARETLMSHGRDHRRFCEVLTGSHHEEAISRPVWDQLNRRLQSLPVEDYRADFEDGYGVRSPGEEHDHAIHAAGVFAAAAAAGTLPPGYGIRIKCLDHNTADQAISTLDVFLTALATACGPACPPGLTITLPKVTQSAQPAALDRLLSQLEETLPALPPVRMELMVETSGSLVDRSGRLLLPSLVDAAGGRCTGVHLGVYDYTSALGISSHQQTPVNAVCEFARRWMQLCLGDRPVRLSDGAWNQVPSGSPDAIVSLWQQSWQGITAAMTAGIYQGWDLLPEQLPARYGSVYLFYRQGLTEATRRLQAWNKRKAATSADAGVMDDAATAAGLQRFFARALQCGAITRDEFVAAGATPEDSHG